MSKKTIKVNPLLFQEEPNKKPKGPKTRKQRKSKAVEHSGNQLNDKSTSKEKNNLKPSVSIASLKNKLLKRMKQHKRPPTDIKPKSLTPNSGTMSAKTKKQSTPKLPTPSFSPDSEYTESVQLMTELSKNNAPASNPIQVSTELPDSLKPSAPKTMKRYNEKPYGCMKNGTKVTYRQWKQTNPPPPSSDGSSPITIRPPQAPINMSFSEVNNPAPTAPSPKPFVPDPSPSKIIPPKTTSAHEQNISKLNNTRAMLQDIYKQQPATRPASKTRKIRKRKKYKIAVGRNSTKRKMAVLLSGEKLQPLHKRPSTDAPNDDNAIIKVLRRGNLICTDNSCPKELIQSIYDNVQSIGTLSNKNKKTLYRNFVDIVQHDEEL